MWPDTIPLWVGVLLWLVLWCAGSVVAGLFIGRFIAAGRGQTGGEEIGILVSRIHRWAPLGIRHRRSEGTAMKLANRFKPYFTHRPGSVGICREDRTREAFICKLCGRVLAPNSAGANSHIAKHVRQRRAEAQP